MNAQKKAGEKKSEKAPASSVLRHPVRIRILETVNERDMSPIQFLNSGLCPDQSQKALSSISYHFRELERYGCVEVVDLVQRRGATEHVYRGTARAYFTDAEWEQFSSKERRLISRTMYAGRGRDDVAHLRLPHRPAPVVVLDGGGRTGLVRTDGDPRRRLRHRRSDPPRHRESDCGFRGKNDPGHDRHAGLRIAATPATTDSLNPEKDVQSL